MVQTISNLVIDGPEEQKSLAKTLQGDLLKATAASDVEFINKVIVPVLHSEKTVPITISVINT